MTPEAAPVRGLQCPGCSTEMARHTLDGHYGTRVVLDLCRSCGAFWFDGYEGLALSPGAILRLFVVIHEHQAERRGPLPERLGCPRCHETLVHTLDRQRATRFSYSRCPSEHGRFIAFAEFLREKNFVRPLSGAELAELRSNVRQVQCSSCGASIDLERGSACAYCRAPVSILDDAQVEAVVAELKQAEEKRGTVDPTLPVRLAMDRMEAERIWRKLDLASWKTAWLSRSSSLGLVEAGVAAVVGFLDAVGLRDPPP